MRGLDLVDRGFIAAREPHVAGVAALWSPDSGRLDASMLVLALRRVAEAAGAVSLLSAPLAGGRPGGDGYELRTAPETVAASVVVNAAGPVCRRGIGACSTARPSDLSVPGEYASLRPSRRGLVNGLVYPLPHPSGHGLGVHLTRTSDGIVLLGPTDQIPGREGRLRGRPAARGSVPGAARQLLRGLTLEDLREAGTGIRAKLHPPEESFADFLIRRDRRHAALIHAAGIDSPGLTSCLAIGARVAGLVDETLRC